MLFFTKKSILFPIIAFIITSLALFSFQNCSNVKFTEIPQETTFSSLAPPTLKCSGPLVPCETDRFNGQQTCTDTPDGPVYGTCTFISCKSPFELINGICQSRVCSNGTSEACTFQGSNGLRFCENNAWGNCKWIKVSVNGLPVVTLNQGLSYNFEVQTSDSAVQLAVNKKTTLSRVSGTCSNLNSLVDPWLLNARPFNLGSNMLDYDLTTSNDLGNCDWTGKVFSNIDGVVAQIAISARKTSAPPSGCVNGANNPPLCNQCPATAPNLVNGQCVANCTNGANNPPLCNQFPPCTNGATNPPACNTCPALTPNLVNGQCVANCLNGANNPPLCNQFPPCTNGATNPPACNTCPALTPNLVNGQCVANCLNGANNPPLCNQFPPCTNGATNPPACNTCPATAPNLVNGQCVANCTNGANNPPLCNQFPPCTNGATNPPLCNQFPPCTNGATNPPLCNQFPPCTNNATNPPLCNLCPASLPNLVNGQCIANCTNGATNPPLCNSCPASKPNLVNGQCVANCTNGATNPPLCNSCPASKPNLVNGQCVANCTNGATNPPLCNSCPASKPNLVNGQCVANCTNGATNPPLCNSCPISKPYMINGRCEAGCANGALNPPLCTEFPTCSNGASNYPSCNECASSGKVYVNGLCVNPCTNGGTNPPTCTSCVAPNTYNSGNGKCERECGVLQTPVACQLVEKCSAARGGNTVAVNQYLPHPAATINVSGRPTQSVAVARSMITFTNLASNEVVSLWNTTPAGASSVFTLQCQSHGGWDQAPGGGGWCQVTRTLSDSDSRCAIVYENPTSSYCGSWDGKHISATRLWQTQGNLKFYVGTSGASADTVSCMGVWDTSTGTWVRSAMCKYANKRECHTGNLSSTRAYEDYPACPEGTNPAGDGCSSGTGTGSGGWRINDNNNSDSF